MGRKWLRYTAVVVVICIAGWMLLLGAALIYVQANKKTLIGIIESGFSKRVSGVLSFDDISVDFLENFPDVSVGLRNFKVRDSTNLHGPALLSVDHLYAGFGILKVLFGNRNPKRVTIANGRIHFFSDSAGRKNWNILTRSSGTNGSLTPSKVTLKNVDVIFEDKGKSKFYEVLFKKMKCSIETHDGRMSFEMANDALVKFAYFDTHIGSYLTDKSLVATWHILYDKGTKRIELVNQQVRLNKQPFRISANFLLGKDPRFDLSIKASSLSLSEAASIFPERTQQHINQFKLSKRLTNIDAFLTGEMKYGALPFAQIRFKASNASVDVPSVQFAHCSFDGFFKNVVDSSFPPSDSNSVIQFSNVRGEWQSNPFDCKKASFYNLIHPYLNCDVHFVFELAKLDSAIGSRRLDLAGGSGEAAVNYQGPLTRADTLYNLNGTVTIRDADLRYNPRNLGFKKTDIDLSFVNGDMVVRKMNTEINGDKIRINGTLKGFLNFFSTATAKADFDWNIYSPYLDISKLRSSLRRSASTKEKKARYSFLQRLNNRIDSLFDNCNAYLNVKADRVSYKKFVASKVSGKLTLRNDAVAIDHFSLLHAGGSVVVNAASTDHGNTSDLSLQSKMQNVNVRELFSAFNNFGMESLRSENINGNFSADINLTSELDADNNLYRPANKGYVVFALENGMLENFRPLMDIDNHFLQKRDLSRIAFADLKDRLEIRGNDIEVNRMEIKSTAINMYVQGTYSFAGHTDLSIQIPLLGQKKDQVEAPAAKGNNSKGGISVFLRAKDDKDGKLKIAYDPLARFRKKK